MSPLPASVQARLAELRKSFVLKLPDRLKEIEDDCESLARDGWNATVALNAYRGAHSMAGSCGTYGFHEPSRIARLLEAPLGESSRNQVPLTEPQGAEVRRQLSTLHAAFP